MRISALALISFPTRPRDLLPWDREALGQALIERGQAVVRGDHADTGTIIVPYPRRVPYMAQQEQQGQERSNMEATLSYYDGDSRESAWDNVSRYKKLPSAYVAAIAAACENLESYVKNMAGEAASEEDKYTVTFTWSGGKGQAKEKGEAKATNLRYSQVRECQKAGMRMLQELGEQGDAEVASGQRK